ncbi:MAG: long-chain fatty acid--CoA ligase [Rhodobacterales bacterium]|nr:long-chain fatty acid--CoA ligase [Rhodobacterales bacterium]
MDLSSWIDAHAEFDPAKPALRYEGMELTYGDFAAGIHAMARVLKHRHGVGRGDRVAYLGLNSPQFLLLLFACARLGALFIPLNWRLAGPEHVFILTDSTAKVLVVEDEFRAHVEAFRDGIEDCAFVAGDFADPAWETLDDDPGPGVDDRNPHVDRDTPLLLVYTSGTTGHPKGAVLTQDALFWNALNSLHCHDMTSADHILTVLPMFHVGGLNIQTTPALYAGATVTIHRKFDPVATLRAIARDRPTLTVQVPATMAALIALPDWADADLSSLRAMTTGSSIVPRPLLAAFNDRGVPALQVYGSTETAPVAVYLRAADAARKEGSVGKTALHGDLRIVDDAGRDVAPGQSGELWVRGGNVMYEYWGNEKATQEALRDGWYHTGDVGYRDDEGFVYINDRKKDMIISGGENIYPAELEAVLHAMDDLADAVVVGRPDPRWGEVPVAVVVPGMGVEVTRDEILGRFDGRLARFKHPKDVVFVNTLPRNVMGKVLKFEVREMVADTPAA